MNYIRLTVDLDENNPVYEWLEKQENKFLAEGHIGTHLDRYEFSQIPMDYFKSRAVLFNVKNTTVIELKENELNEIKTGDFVIFHTGHLKKYRYGNKDYFKNHPILSDDLVNSLLKRKVRFIGIDSPGIKSGAEHEKIDRECEKNKVFVIENIANLEKIEKKCFTIYTSWIDEAKKTGLRCSIVAEM